MDNPEVLLHLQAYTNSAALTVMTPDGKVLTQVFVPWDQIDALRKSATSESPVISTQIAMPEVAH